MALRKLFTSNKTSASYDALTETTTRPTDGVLTTIGRFPFVRLMFFGSGSNNTTGQIQVIGWTQQATVGAGNIVTPTGRYVPTIIGRVDFTLSTFVGTSGGVVGDSERYADTVALSTTVGATTRLEAASNALDMPAHIMLNPLTFDLVQVQAIVGASSPATSVNVLFEEMTT